MISPKTLPRRASALTTIVWGGLIAGFLDGLDAVVFYDWMRGAPLMNIFKFIASGLLGIPAFHAGWAAILLGVALHFLIATSAATAYYLLSCKIPLLLGRPLLAGPVFGLALFFFMHYLVVPLSAAPKQPPIHLDSFLNLVFSHVVFVGIPIALIASYSAQSESH